MGRGGVYTEWTEVDAPRPGQSCHLEAWPPARPLLTLFTRIFLSHLRRPVSYRTKMPLVSVIAYNIIIYRPINCLLDL